MPTPPPNMSSSRRPNIDDLLIETTELPSPLITDAVRTVLLPEAKKALTNGSNNVYGNQPSTQTSRYQRPLAQYKSQANLIERKSDDSPTLVLNLHEQANPIIIGSKTTIIPSSKTLLRS